MVRDLLLGRTIHDLDLVVEGDAADFARRLAVRRGAGVRIHARFATATLEISGGDRVDVARTRRETYDRPGALPSVSGGGSIEEDLARRDFTINAMALEIAPRRRFVDPFGGRRDLFRRLIRILHAASFRDDPTRAFRAARYAARLGFRIAPAARRAMVDAIRSGAFDTVSGDRIRRELALILTEEERLRAVRWLRRLGLDAAIAPALSEATDAPARIRRAAAIAKRSSARVTWLCFLLAWMGDADEDAAARVAERLRLVGVDGERLRAWPKTRRRLRPGLGSLDAAGVNALTRGLSNDEIVAAAAGLPRADRQALLRNALSASRVRLGIRGRDLVAAGIPAGPAIGDALSRTLAARQDGRISSGEELEFALQAARSVFHGER